MTPLLASLAQAYPYAALAVAVLVVAVWVSGMVGEHNRQEKEQ
jgi:hypothetical protein